ncbi:MAG: hypothetical protein JWM16_2201 [Verrucomicrobiales bacterium]|nr:hypothetical protein [Verrucomicrobiales bacterium]
MKKSLSLLAILIAFGATSFWALSGANRGWTKTSVPVKTLDEVTGIEGVQYQSHFVPGLDFLSVSLAGAGVLFGASFFFRKQPIKTS